MTEKHGKHGTPEHKAWASMLQRCTNLKNAMWPHYGGRGIKVCDRWLDFKHFYADMGDRPEGTSIDRQDNDGNYEPGNCRWATDIEQNNNTSHNRFITLDGVTKTLAQWARERGLKHRTVRMRLMRGYTEEQALQTEHFKAGRPRKEEHHV